ncbi:hypothetical protein KCU61_g274, partial [Aureobasidium melanogenum]
MIEPRLSTLDTTSIVNSRLCLCSVHNASKRFHPLPASHHSYRKHQRAALLLEQYSLRTISKPSRRSGTKTVEVICVQHMRKTMCILLPLLAACAALQRTSIIALLGAAVVANINRLVEVTIHTFNGSKGLPVLTVEDDIFAELHGTGDEQTESVSLSLIAKTVDRTCKDTTQRSYACGISTSIETYRVRRVVQSHVDVVIFSIVICISVLVAGLLFLLRLERIGSIVEHFDCIQVCVALEKIITPSSLTRNRERARFSETYHGETEDCRDQIMDGGGKCSRESQSFYSTTTLKKSPTASTWRKKSHLPHDCYVIRPSKRSSIFSKDFLVPRSTLYYSTQP